MSLSADLTLVERALDDLERREVRVLVWGLVDSALAEIEVDEALDQLLIDRRNVPILSRPDCTINGAADLKRSLLELGLLMLVPGRTGSAIRFRTRMAEGVRLFARLRQLFPGQHEGRSGWISGSTLVADYRLLWRPRRYPSRNLTPNDALSQIGQCVVSSSFLDAIGFWFAKGDPSWRLARFQIDAATRIIEGLESGVPRGTVVAAGTGSGKTLAFYLPALSWLAAQKKPGAQSGGVRILALYPRNELLKDQLGEVFDQSRKFDDLLGRSGTTLSVGVLYGDTPTTLRSAPEKWQGGKCPFFRCPSCSGDMHIQSATVAEAEARLVCRSCGAIVESRQMRLTRRAIQDDPPDILFTSVEMLNQRMSDSTMRHLFGLGPRAQRVPPLMLLDEVHLYSGTYGSQVAYLLRRWSAQTRRRTHFVGLSATIAEGKAFFASLVDMDPAIVEEITPRHEDMVEEGAEYMLALRGDPVSQSALLSTSIQSLMLASRLLDRRQDVGKAHPFAGWRAFAFTDQVDATNRLFYDLRDAEGRTAEGHPATGRHPRGGLAHLREPGPSLRRYEGGQDWRLIKQIGHDLGTRLKVDRTTAYHSGVDHHAEIVVATAALEVGYDDPAVGVVLQHKAPRDMAQFLQRKGRAGRTRHMRPWTVMVLSDYGRDRLAYQSYEQFFDPELPPRELPMSNRYVRRMQATYALVDYLGIAMQVGEPAGSVWNDMAAPRNADIEKWPTGAQKRLKEVLAENAFPIAGAKWHSLRSQALDAAPQRQPALKWAGVNWLQNRLRRPHLVRLLGSLLKDSAATEAFAQHLGSTLGVSREEVDSLLWDHPRPILLGAIPTAMRRLITDWRALGQPRADRSASNPLPDFAPPTLFSDLSLPEVRLMGGSVPYTNSVPALPVLQALSEMAPGKVSRRLDQALWLGPTEEQLTTMLATTPVRPGGCRFDLDVDAWYALEPQVPFYRIENGSVVDCNAYRPLDLLLSAPPSVSAANRPQVRDTSNARLVWRSQVFGRHFGARLHSPSDRVGIARLVDSVIVHTHASQSAATVRRYAVASKVNLRIRRGRDVTSHSATWCFTKESQPCGIGFEIEADALCFVLRLPPSPSIACAQSDGAVQRAARTARFAWEAQYGDALASVEENPFLRGWLAQIFQVAACAISQERECDLVTAFDLLVEPTEGQRLQGVLTVIFQSPDAPDDDEEQPLQAREPRLRQALSTSLGNPDTLQALKELGLKLLTGPIDAQWDMWLRQALMHTLGAAILDTIQQACPQVDTEELAVDIDAGPREDGSMREASELWLSEINPGGNGLIEQVVDAIATDTVHFYRGIEAALGPSEFEQIDLQLRDFVGRIGQQPVDENLLALTQSVRNATSSRQAQEHLASLRTLLAERGHAVFHGYVSALSSRVLRPDSPPALDQLLAEMLSRWETLEERVGVEVDARVVCALFCTDVRIDEAFVQAGYDLPSHNQETWRFGMLLGVIWARGHALRANSLPLPARFSDAPAVTERLLLAAWLSAPDELILASDPHWLQTLHGRLVQHGRAVVTLSPDVVLLNSVMASLVTSPVQLEYLNVYPRITSIVRRQGEIQLHLELEATV